MIKSLRESKAKLSELVERASQGEDVLITVRGKPKARLTRVSPPDEEMDMKGWADELASLHKTYGVGVEGISVERILSEDRDERCL